MFSPPAQLAWQALIESAFLTFAPIVLLSGDVNGKGVVTSTYDYGTMTYALVVIQVTLKVALFVCNVLVFCICRRIEELLSGPNPFEATLVWTSLGPARTNPRRCPCAMLISA